MTLLSDVCPTCGQKRRRTSAQNNLMWTMLKDISNQVIWHGNKLTADEWKDVFSAALKKQKVVAGIDGGFVVCGQSTSRMNSSEMSDLILLIEAFAANHDVIFNKI